MIKKIIELNLKNYFLTILVIIILLFGSIWAVKKTSLDALPDLSPVQVIVQVKWQGQSPKIIQDQVVYPLVTNLMSLKNIQTVRGMSSFSNALVYVIFKDGVDIYDAREKILEKLAELTPTLPKSVSVSMGSDATGVGWAFEYALKSKSKSLAELRTLQEYFYKYALLGIDGVSEVAPIGGFVKTYEIRVKQDKLIEYNITLADILKAIRENNNDIGGGVILENGQEQIIQASGYIKSIKDIENITLKLVNSTPLKVKDIADVVVAPAPRRGMADLNGKGEVVGGIVIVRFNENPYRVIKAVKKRLSELKVDGVEVVTTYDRSSLIEKAIKNLNNTLVEESIIVMLIVMIFLLHFRSSLVIIITLPITVMLTFLFMKFFNIGSNIMSLGGIAIAIGAMVDASIVMVENSHKYLLRLPQALQKSKKERLRAILEATSQVGKPIFFALLLIVVSFLPIFALSGQEGKLFSPLAYTKTFAMVIGAVLSITVVPILILFFVRGKIVEENKNVVNRFFQFFYEPILKISLKLRYGVLLVAILLMAAIYPLYKSFKWEFMPMLDEKTFMYMPVTPYGIGIDLSKEITQKTDEIIATLPEVKSVFGKAGRADTATDPAPLAMIETIITLKDESKWREGITTRDIMQELDKKLQLPGLINSWTYPIRGRIDMLLTGIRTPLGIKLYGNDLYKLEDVATRIEQKLKDFNKTLSVTSDKINSGYYLDIDLNLEAMSRFGVAKSQILDAISYLVGAQRVSTLYNKDERYAITLRLDAEERSDIRALEELKIITRNGYFPLKEFAKLKYTEGPSVIKSEKGLNVAFIYITPKPGVSATEYKKEAKALLEKVDMPAGYFVEWAGSSEYLESAIEKLQYIIPLSLVLVFILIYFAIGQLNYSFVIFFSLPFALLGGLLYIYYLDYNISIAVIVGFLSLIGVAAETSIVMLIYLQEELEKIGSRFQKEQLKEAIFKGAVMRLRPKLMTVFAIILSLLPIMRSHGVGSEVMQRIAAPMIGGMVSSTLLTLILIPVIFYMIEKRKCNTRQM